MSTLIAGEIMQKNKIPLSEIAIIVCLIKTQFNEQMYPKSTQKII